jgi:hypothetical protein
MMMWIFASQSSRASPIAHPLDALSTFLEVFSDDFFDWEAFCISPTKITTTSPSFVPFKMNKALYRDMLSQQDGANQFRIEFERVIEKYATLATSEDANKTQGDIWAEDEQELQAQMQGEFNATAVVDSKDVMFRGVDRIFIQDPVMLKESNLLAHLFTEDNRVVVDSQLITATLKKGYADFLSVLNDVLRRGEDGQLDFAYHFMSNTRQVVVLQSRAQQFEPVSVCGDDSVSQSTSITEILEMISFTETAIEAKVSS